MTLSDARIATLAEIANAAADRAPEDYQFFMRELIQEVRDGREGFAKMARNLAGERESTKEALANHEDAFADVVAFLATVYQGDTLLLEGRVSGYGYVLINHPAVGNLAFRVSNCYLDRFPPRIARITHWDGEGVDAKEVGSRLRALAAHEWTWHGGIGEPLPPLTPAELAARPF